MSCELCYFEHNDKRIGPCSYCKEQDKNEPKYSIGQFVEISPHNYVGHIENIYTSEDGTEETLYHVKGFHEGKPFVLIKKESELSKLKAVFDPDKLAKITYKYTDAVVKGGPKHEDRLYLDNTLSVIIGQLALNASYLQRILKLLCEDRDITYHEIEIECQEHGLDLVNAIICDIKRKENENA